MTISKANTTYQACPICEIDYTYTEKQDTKKVVELACTHFFHMQCIGDWFSTNQTDREDLSCRYCDQLCVEKYNPTLYTGEDALNTLDNQIQYLSHIPSEIKTSSVPVFHKIGDSLFRMRVSNNYLERATAARMYDKLQNHQQFKYYIKDLKNFYGYDEGVINAIPHARNLLTRLADFLLQEEEPIESRKEIFLLLEDTLKRMDITDDLKEHTRLIIYKFLFNRPALRTLTEEVDRWKKVPVRNWPFFIKGRGGVVRVLEEDGSAKIYKSADFKELVLAAGGTVEPPVEKMTIAANIVVIGTISFAILSSIFKRS